MTLSDRHIALQNMCSTWIRNRSFKSVGQSEISFVGYVADYVAICGICNADHTRYARHAGLNKKSMTFSINGERVLSGDIDRWYTCIFEVKVSRSDFLHTFGAGDTAHAKARLQPSGTAHWIVADKGVCDPDEVPSFWGLLTPYGTGLREVKMPILNILPERDLHRMAFDMLWAQTNSPVSSYRARQKLRKYIGQLRASLTLGHSKEELMAITEDMMKIYPGLA